MIVRAQSAVLITLRVRHDRHRDERARLTMVLDQRTNVEIGERVAVDDQEGRTEKGNRTSRTSGGTEHRDFPGIADTHAEGTAVANESRQRVRQMMQVQD